MTRPFRRKTRIKMIRTLCLLIFFSIFLISTEPFAAPPGDIPVSSSPAVQTTCLDILSTSDIHCRYLPYDYTKDQFDKAGSLARISTLVKQIRGQNDNSILIDVGDSIQGSLSHSYLNSSIHPYAQASNFMKYDVWVLGNHEFNFGIGNLTRVMSQVDAQILCGNVYYPDGSSFAPSSAIINKNGIRIGVIGMVTPSVRLYAKDKLGGCKVTDPLTETKKLIRKLRPQCDVLIAAEHMGVEEEYGVYGSGARDLAEACPELDVILAAHAHTRVRELFINGVLITENRKLGKTLSDIRLSLAPLPGGGYKVLAKKAFSLDACKASPDPAFETVMQGFRESSDIENDRIVGTLAGGDLTPDPIIAAAEKKPAASEISKDAAEDITLSYDSVEYHMDIVRSQTCDSAPETDASAKTLSPDSIRTGSPSSPAPSVLRFDSSLPLAARGRSTLADFINKVQMKFTGADLSATSLPSDSAGVKAGNIKVRDLRHIYPEDYTLYKLKITGKQLRQYLEWSAGYYKVTAVRSEDRGHMTGDHTTSSGSTLLVSPARGRDECDVFSGILYRIDLSRPEGSRITALTREDGSPIRDADTFSLAVNRVRAAQLLEGNEIFPEGQPHPKLIQADVHDEYSGLREMIGAFLARQSAL